MIESRIFGKLPNGETVIAYNIESGAGFRATILSYGATLQSLTFPDGLDIVLGFDSLEAYLGEHPYFGAAIGRVANRMSGASFEIDGATYELPQNEGPNNLHSGPIGFDRVNWKGQIQENSLILSHISPDGHQGFPGELRTELRFTFNGSTLALNIQAVIDKPCPVNITYHPYFNLTDGGATPCTDHLLQIFARTFTPSDSTNIPTGEISSILAGSKYYYADPKPIEPKDQLDQNFIIKSLKDGSNHMVKMAKLSSTLTGHKVIICSTQNCLQAYTGGHISEMKGKAGTAYGSYHGVALEPQGYPNALKHDNFPSNILRPDDIYHQKFSYTFRPGEAQA